MTSGATLPTPYLKFQRIQNRMLRSGVNEPRSTRLLHPCRVAACGARESAGSAGLVRLLLPGFVSCCPGGICRDSTCADFRGGRWVFAPGCSVFRGCSDRLRSACRRSQATLKRKSATAAATAWCRQGVHDRVDGGLQGKQTFGDPAEGSESGKDRSAEANDRVGGCPAQEQERRQDGGDDQQLHGLNPQIEAEDGRRRVASA